MIWPQKKNPRAVAAAGGFRNHFNQPSQYIPSAAPVDMVLARLDRVKPVGKDRWRAQCPVHDGHSLQVTEFDSGKVGLRCWGCDAGAAEICRALGLELRDLFPHDPTWKPDPSRPRINRELREQLSLDRWIGHICLYDLFHDRPVKGGDLDCAAGAFNRLRRYSPRFFDEAVRVHRLEVEA